MSDMERLEVMHAAAVKAEVDKLAAFNGIVERARHTVRMEGNCLGKSMEYRINALILALAEEKKKL